MKLGIQMTENGFLFVTENSGFNRVSHQLIRGLALLLVVITAACSGADDDIRAPEHILEMENVTIYSYADIEAADTLTLVREQVFGDTDEVILGRISSVEVDGMGRVFIADRDLVTIHVYNPDGSYLKSLGRQGRGPGEFLIVSSSTQMSVNSNRLFVTDGDGKYIHRYHEFMLDDLSLLHTVNLKVENKGNFDEEFEKYYPRWVYPRNDGKRLVAYTFIQSHEYHEKERMIRYYLHDIDGNIISGPVIKQKDLTYLVYRYTGVGNHAFSFPFFGKSVLAISDHDHLYAVRTDEFKIDVFDPDGKHIRVIQHPYEKVPVTRSELISMYEKIDMTRLDRYQGDDVALNMIRAADNLPDSWPALNDLLIDDENRLWVSTIVEDFDIYEWWVLEESGELITKFEWLRDEPIEVIKNGYVYTRQTDEETGLQQVMRYRVEFSE